METYQRRIKEEEKKERQEEKSLWLRVFCPEHRCSIRESTDMP
jgi:hypothetical protein